MPWARLDDNFPFHRKTVVALEQLRGRERLQRVIGQYALGLLFANKYLTDGFIPDAEVAKTQGETLAAALVSAGLWERGTGGFLIHDYHACNDTAADIKARRAADSERKRLARGGVIPASPVTPVTPVTPVPSATSRGPAPKQAPVTPSVSTLCPAGQPHVSGWTKLAVRSDRDACPAGQADVSARTPRALAGARAIAPAPVIRTVPSQGHAEERSASASDKSTAGGGTPAPSAEEKGPEQPIDHNAEAEANYRVILRIAHEVMAQVGIDPESDVIDAIKWACSKAKVSYNGRVVQKAYDAAKVQRAKKAGTA